MNLLPRVCAIGLCCLVAAAPGCRGSQRQQDRPPSDVGPAGRAALLPVTLPDLSPVDETVRVQAQEQYAALTRKLADPATLDRDLGVAFGEFGVLLHAAEFYEAAKPAYLNAQTLMPRDARWPYYLAHLYRSEGDARQAIGSFQRARELNPSDIPTLVWLGRTYNDVGEPENAAPLFEQALSLAPNTIAALAGLGQAALARKDFHRAVDVLERALSIDSSAASLHSPLAMAYRGLGDTARADAHIRQWRNTEIVVPDPLRAQLDIALQSGLAYELRGVRALEARDFRTAADLFRRGLELAPAGSTLSRSIRHKLGTALALGGDVSGAIAQFDAVVRAAPHDAQDEPAAKAHYSLGVLAAGSGSLDEAVTHLTAALRYAPSYVEARLALGDVLRRHGRFAQSLTHYAEALKINPQAADARFGYAMALVRMDRYREARDWLEEAVRVQPDRPEFADALARILAAAPDASVRDGRRAMAIVQQLFASHQSPELVETMAMAAAEVGDYTQAARIQRELMDSARREGQYAVMNRLAANLQRYEKGQPSRVPWPADHPAHQPGI